MAAIWTPSPRRGEGQVTGAKEAACFPLRRFVEVLRRRYRVAAAPGEQTATYKPDTDQEDCHPREGHGKSARQR